MSNTYYAPLPTSMAQVQPNYSTSQVSYATGGPVQHPLASQYMQSIPSVPQHSHSHSHGHVSSIRPSSGAWNPTDDATLMAARAQGMNWAPIQQSYFPSKTPNACRKRHERLVERRNADDWDGLKLENLAKSYMNMRREIWSGLALQTGEKWNVVEQKVCASLFPIPLHLSSNISQCMSQGLKNLQASARSCARRERMLDAHTSNTGIPVGAYDTDPHPEHDSGHTDDSGIGIDGSDLEAEYDADGASDHSGSHAGSLSGYAPYGMGGGMSRQGMSSGGGRRGRGAPQYGHQQRLPSMDMGIDAIINRPNGR
jgi:hypothetical protein